MGKIVTLDYISKNLEPYTATCTGGGFDLFHVGHLRYLRACSEFGRPFVVIVQGDETVRIRKGHNRPIINELERAEIVAALDFVDFVLVLEKQSYANEYLEIIKPKRYVFSKENIIYRKERALIMKKDFPEMEIVFQNITREQGTTKIIDKIKTTEDYSNISDSITRVLFETAAQSMSSVGKASAVLVDEKENILQSAHNSEDGEKHAEMIILDKIDLNSLDNMKIVTNFPPCISCAKKLVESGIKKVEYIYSYGIDDGIEYLKEHGVSVLKRPVNFK